MRRREHVRLAWAAVLLALVPIRPFREFAFTMTVGVLLDSFVVRSFLVPALVSMFGKWNWWMPDWTARVLRVTPSHPHAEVEAAPATP